jgi:hypothetical protein
MAKAKRRGYGEIPTWAMGGNVNLGNYDLRAEFYMKTRSDAGREETPYLRLPHLRSEDETVADFPGWMQYFIRHLGGYPRTVRMWLEGYMTALNVPENKPEQFDEMFDRSPNFLLPMTVSIAEMQWRERAASRAPEPAETHNLFVPTFAPRYQEMVERGGRPGVSLEDSARGGVWIPRDWYQPR